MKPLHEAIDLGEGGRERRAVGALRAGRRRQHDQHERENGAAGSSHGG